MWDEVVGATLYHVVYRATNSTDNWLDIYSGPNHEVFFRLPDGNWDLKVRAANAEVGSDWSPIRNITVPLQSDGDANGGAS